MSDNGRTHDSDRQSGARRRRYAIRAIRNSTGTRAEQYVRKEYVQYATASSSIDRRMQWPPFVRCRATTATPRTRSTHSALGWF